MTELACLHIPDFSAWALARRWSSPRSRPTGIVVSVGGRVHAFSANLTATGIRAGDSLDRARKLAPDAEFHLRDTEIERAVWENLLCRMHRLTPRLQSVSPTGNPDSASTTPLSAWALMQAPDSEALRELGSELHAKVGIASHRPWSVLAAAYSKPGEVTQIPSHMTTAFLRQAHVSLLQCVGFSEDLIQRFLLFGLKAIQHLVELTQRHLSSQFGKEGMQLFQFLHPPEKESPVPNYDPQVIDADFDFDNPAFEPAQLEPVVPHQVERLVALLQGKPARHIELHLKERTSPTEGQRRRERRAGHILKDPTAQTERLCAAAQYLLRQTIEDPSRPTVGIDTMSIILSSLTQPHSVQTDLFAKKPTLLPLFKNMGQQFPGKLLRPTFNHADPFFPEESYRFEPVCP